MTTPSVIARVYRALVAESLVPLKPEAAARVAFDAVGKPVPALPDSFGLDPDRDGAWLSAELEASARQWEVAGAMARATADPHTLILPPKRVEQVMALVAGAPTTLPGFSVHRAESDGFVVGEVVSGSAAQASGLRPGDVVVRLGSTPVTRGMVDVFWQFPGTSNEDTDVEILRGGVKDVLKLRARLGRLPVLDARVLTGGVGYVRLRIVGASETPEWDAAGRLRSAIEAHERAKVRGIILDLRSNPGGYGVTRVASVLTPMDPIIVYRDARGAEEIEHRVGASTSFAGPLVVLVDDQTLSAAEMIALCLREQRGARVVGTPTAGGLNVPSRTMLEGGYLFMFPERLAVGPCSRRAPDGMRVTPDVIVPNRTPEDLAGGRDPQLDAAIAMLAP